VVTIGLDQPKEAAAPLKAPETQLAELINDPRDGIYEKASNPVYNYLKIPETGPDLYSDSVG
jgi:hypothetical protein